MPATYRVSNISANQKLTIVGQLLQHFGVMGSTQIQLNCKDMTQFVHGEALGQKLSLEIPTKAMKDLAFLWVHIMAIVPRRASD